MASVSLCVNILRWLPVAFVAFLFIWSSYAYIVQMCFYMVSNTAERVIYLFFYLLLLFMSIWCFVKALFTVSATVPNQFYLTESELEIAARSKEESKNILEAKGFKLRVQGRTVRGCVRFCEECKCIKPDRAHHCSTCEKCILKMDHHCPWINNCVCYSNYKFFFLFISYSFLLCLYIATTSCQYFIIFWTSFSHDMEKTDLVGLNLVFLFLVDSIVGFSLLTLLFFHTQLLSKNRTTLESLRAPVFRSGPDKNAYNKGCKKNFSEIFGESPLYWFLPIFTDLGDGVNYCSRISALPVGYRSMDNNFSTVAIMAKMLKIETISVPVQPNKVLSTEVREPNASYSQRDVIALRALSDVAAHSQLSAEKHKRFM